jgi:hypothetical protein
MNPLELPLLADENIHAEVVAVLRKQGKDVRTVEVKRFSVATTGT